MSGVDRVRLRLERVGAAVGEINPAFLDTPALRCAPLGRTLGCSVTLKLETLKAVRSFKGRGTETVAAVAAGAGRRAWCARAPAISGRRWPTAALVVAWPSPSRRRPERNVGPTVTCRER